MRMQLFELTIERTSCKAHGHVVAMDELTAAEVVVDHDNALGQEHERFWLTRVDDTL